MDPKTKQVFKELLDQLTSEHSYKADNDRCDEYPCPVCAMIAAAEDLLDATRHTYTFHIPQPDGHVLTVRTYGSTWLEAAENAYREYGVGLELAYRLK